SPQRTNGQTCGQTLGKTRDASLSHRTKCEQATQGSECITSASFDVDIENFVHQQEREHKPFFSEDPELDNLVSLEMIH
uniref:MEIS N-terminal domain-containing protein n=1 Tax=Salarias fasciatus TaxID=181472 RepID=A0A672JJQ3_SALFA